MRVAIKQAQDSEYLQRVLTTQAGACDYQQAEYELVLSGSDNGLELQWWPTQTSKAVSLKLDYLKTARQIKSFPLAKQGAFNQALGKKSRTIVDLSGGFGQDSLLMSLQGYRVIVLERLPLMSVLMEEAFARLDDSEILAAVPWHRPEVISGDAGELVNSVVDGVDCAYFDPMFPPKRKRSAATNKFMQFLQVFAGEDADAAQVAQQIVSSKIPRLVIKRPTHAEPLLPQPHSKFGSKLINYDVYYC